jgi:hypothetical protein
MDKDENAKDKFQNDESTRVKTQDFWISLWWNAENSNDESNSSIWSSQ